MRPDCAGLVSVAAELEKVMRNGSTSEGKTPPQIASAELDARARRALADYRLEAFDNVDVARVLASTPMPLERAAWVGRCLATNGRSARAFQEGREIMSAAAAQAQG